VLLLVLLIAFCTYWYIQPIGSVSYKTKIIYAQSSTKKDAINWPVTSQAAIGSVDEGVLAEKPNQVAKPTASTAKLITALVVLQQKPLELGQQGPKITLTQNDVDIYNQYFARDGSVAQVQAGEQLTQYQLLQGMMLPSANNYADTLAIWTFGSLEKYQKVAQKYVDQLGLKNTKIGPDASGFNPATVSTAEDLTKLAVVAMKNKTITEIVDQPQVNLPVAGIKDNTNWLLGADGVIGIKTGNTTEAGGVYIFASKFEYDKSHSTIIVGAVQGEPTVISAIHQSRLLLGQAKSYYKLVSVAKKNQTIAVYSSSWGKNVDAIAENDLSVLRWDSTSVKPQINLNNINAPANKGVRVGVIKVGDTSTNVVLGQSLQLPDWQWRILRYF